MPWTGPQFAERHNHHLGPAQATHAASIANAIMRRGEPEGIAIATANKHFERRDDGGGIADPTGQIGGITPTAQTMSPLMQGMIQRYSSMPDEKLREMSVMMGGSPQGQIIQRILARKQIQPTQPAQAPVALASGGLTPEASPWWTRSAERSEDQGRGATGYLHGTTSGRADDILTTAPAGSHVIPADVVSGLGEGNSLAGARIMDEIIRTGPGGIPMPSGGGRRSLPTAPTPVQQSRGGATPGDQRPVALSHGEYVVKPEDVIRFGDGDREIGHKVWDHFTVHMRKLIIRQMEKLPPPVGMKSRAAT